MVSVANFSSLGRYFSRVTLVLLVSVGSAFASDNILPEAEASQLFERISEAFKQHSYDGVFVYSHGESMGSLRIVHRRDGDKERERIVNMDGPSHELIRDGEKVLCVHAEGWEGDVNHRIPAGPFAKAFIRDISHYTSGYQVKQLGNSRVVGREAVSFAIKPTDEFRYGYRIWLDEETDLLLKSVLVHGNRVLERFQFTQLDIGKDIADEDLGLGIHGKVFKHEPLLLTEQKNIEHKKPNWKLSWMPKGFIMRMQGIRRAHGESAAADTLTFSDGMTAFSVFVEKADSEHHDMATQMGATVAVGRIVKGPTGKMYFVTVVGEVPMRTAEKLVSSITPVNSVQ